MKRGWYFKVVLEDNELYLLLKKRVLGFFPVLMSKKLVPKGKFIELKVKMIDELEKKGMY